MQTPSSTNPRKRTLSNAPRKKRAPTKASKVSTTSGGIITTRIPRGIPAGCPKQMRVKLRYYTSQVLTCALAQVVDYKTFRANAPNDPDFAIGGGQPRYYDQWAALYNSVTTVGSKCTVEYANEEVNTATTFQNQHVGVAHTSQSTLPGVGINDVMELNYNSHKIAAGQNRTICTVNWKPEQYFIGKTIYDEDIASDVSTTPVRECFFHVYTAATAAGAAISGRTFTITVEYDVIFFDKKYPIAS